MVFPAISALLLILLHGNNSLLVAGFQQLSSFQCNNNNRLKLPVVLGRHRLGSSNYDNEDFVEGRDRGGFYSSSDSFRVAGVGAQGHQVIVPREDHGPRPPSPRGRHMDVTTSYPEGLDSYGRYRSSDEEAPLRVGGRPVEGHQVLRRRRTERGRHMDVTTSNPHFVPTTTTMNGRERRRRRGGPYYEEDEELDAPDRIYRGGSGVRPDIQDLQRVGRMPMQNEEWDRYRNVREESTPFRSHRSSIKDYYYDNNHSEMPHFLATDDGDGLPVRMSFSRRGMDALDSNDFRGLNRESIREREWRDLGAARDSRSQRRRGHFRPDTQDLQGLGRMPMRGEDWDDMAYPERRNVGFQGARRHYPENDLLDDDRHYTVNRRRQDFRREDLEDDHVREGPHMVQSDLPLYGDQERRARREGDDLVDEDRYFRTGSRDLYSRRTRGPPRRDQRGSIGGPMSEELFGIDSEYAASRQSWTAGTSMDTI